jgi:uncharacterized protein (DUF2147 family)
MKVIQVTLLSVSEAYVGTGIPPAQEVILKRLFAVAAFLLASTAAQAQYSFEYGGRTIRVDPDRGTVSIPGVYDNTGRRTKRSRNDQDRDRPRKNAPQQAKVDPQAAPGAAPAQADQTPAPANSTPEPSSATATLAPTDSTPAAQPQAAAPQAQQDPASVAKPAPAPMVATAPVAAPVEKQQAPAPAPAAVQSAATPLGLWMTGEKEGKVRIEQCGVNLCGYSVDAKSNQNGEQVLINMKPGKDAKWSGRILDPNTGSTYDSTIALKGSDSLRVQGCAFGGMFCGGQTWSRVN